MHTTMDQRTVAFKKQNNFFLNLKSLGFKCDKMEKEHRTKFDMQMFSRPNQKAFEVVTYFLFSKLKEVSKEKYNIKWPLCPSDSRIFKKTCVELLSSIAKESPYKFPVISLSLLSSYGEPVYDLFFAFSSHVVLKTNEFSKLEMLLRPCTTIEMHEDIIEILVLAFISTSEKHNEVLKTSERNLKTYFKCSNELVSCIVKLRQSIAANGSLFAKKVEEAQNLYEVNNSSENSMEEVITKSKINQEKVKQDWDKIKHFLTKEQKMWCSISKVLEVNDTEPILKGQDCKIVVPDVLKDKLESNEVDSKDGKKNNCILGYLKTFSAALELILESIKTGNVSETNLYKSLKETKELEKCMVTLKDLSTFLDSNNILTQIQIDDCVENVFLNDKVDLHPDLPPSSKSDLLQKTSESASFSDLFLDSVVKVESTPVSENQSFVERNVGSQSKNSSSTPSSLESTIQMPILKYIFSPLPQSKVLTDVDSMFSPVHDDDDSYDKRPLNSINDESLLQFSLPNQGVSPNLDLHKDPNFYPENFLFEESLNAQSLEDEPSFL